MLQLKNVFLTYRPIQFKALKDSDGINDPDLINGLEEGLYKIEKQYSDGVVDQKVILKDEN